MAPPALLRRCSKLLAPARILSGSSARSKFYVREPPHDRPDWLKVGLTLGTSVFLWIYVSFYSLNVMRPQASGEEKWQCEIAAAQISHPVDVYVIANYVSLHKGSPKD
uniref:NADH dehydrogenase [ubiquinone] 1 subunit C1, mitochondrial n=1 Tax=Suricata suricatta TaxID=37032 RepID=A0A673SMY9_SURSU